MGILDEDVARVRELVDFVQVAGQHVALRKVGSRYVGLCPFHAEKTPSFTINPNLNRYMCFGCQAKGDVITFVRELEHLDFVQAVERLATLAGVQLRYDDAAAGRDRQRRDVLFSAMEKAVEWYHQRLLTGPDAGEARAYLRSRGYDGDVVRRFRIGWSPDGWDTLARALSLPDDVLRDTGLGFVNRVGRQQDAFRRRVMFPIFDTAGKPVAFGGRRLGDGEGPKYKNSSETPIYSKSRTLYALNWAKADVVNAGEVVLCEGYTDVIGFFRAGVERAVATCGTAVTDEHVRIIKGFAPRIVLAYDADAAGQAAAEKFYEWEQRYEVDVHVMPLPGGADPGDLAASDPEALKRAVGEARPFLQFRLDRVLARADLSSPEARARAAERAAAVIGAHPNPAVREQYLQEVALRTRVDRDRVEEARRREMARPVVDARATRYAPLGDSETEALRLMVHQRDEVAGRLAEALFADERHALAFRALASSATVHEAIEVADPGAAELLQRVAVEETTARPDDVVTRLAQERAREALAALQAEARASDDPGAYAPIVGWLSGMLAGELGVDRPLDARVEAAERLVAWLTERSQESQ